MLHLIGILFPHICLTPNLLTTTIVAPPSNASKWQMGFNSAFKGLKKADKAFINITLRKIRAHIVGVEKQQISPILSVCL